MRVFVDGEWVEQTGKVIGQYVFARNAKMVPSEVTPKIKGLFLRFPFIYSCSLTMKYPLWAAGEAPAGT